MEWDLQKREMKKTLHQVWVHILKPAALSQLDASWLHLFWSHHIPGVSLSHSTSSNRQCQLSTTLCCSALSPRLITATSDPSWSAQPVVSLGRTKDERLPRRGRCPWCWSLSTPAVLDEGSMRPYAAGKPFLSTVPAQTYQPRSCLIGFCPRRMRKTFHINID